MRLQSMDREFKRWMKWYGKKHGEYTVSVCSSDDLKASVYQNKNPLCVPLLKQMLLLMNFIIVNKVKSVHT